LFTLSSSCQYTIPHIDGLQELNCSHCPFLPYVPRINGLQILHCNDCYFLFEIPHINALQELQCDNCLHLTHIPRIHGLVKLNCSNCPLLTEIPCINHLLELDCSNCHLLAKISCINLLILNCSNCPLLTDHRQSFNLRLKPSLHDLIQIDQEMNEVQETTYHPNDVWSHKNPNHIESMRKLTWIQRWWRKRCLIKKLEQLIPLIPGPLTLRYHSDSNSHPEIERLLC
jgi:hypothetical protein